ESRHGIRDWESGSLQQRARNSRSEGPRLRPGARCERGWKLRSKKARAVSVSRGRRSMALRQTFHKAPKICPRSSVRLAQGLAACLIGRECSKVIIDPPARELAPFDRLKLAALPYLTAMRARQNQPQARSTSPGQ